MKQIVAIFTLISFLCLCPSNLLAQARKPGPSVPSTSPTTPTTAPASKENMHVKCWYFGYDDYKRGMSLEDPNNRNYVECDMIGARNDYLAGYQSAKGGGPRVCPYKK